MVTPLWQGVDLIRSLVLGLVEPSILWHVAYLGTMGLAGLVVVGRRLDRMLLK
jgi:lipooligosaccharide transport system permease protein